MLSISECQTIANVPLASGVWKLRITASVTCTDGDGRLVVGSPDFYIEVDGTYSDNKITWDAFDLPFTDLSSKPRSLTFTGKIYRNGALKETLFKNWRTDSSLGDAVSFSTWEADNLTVQRPLGDTFYNKNQINVWRASLVNMATKALTNVFGAVRLFEAAEDTADPVVMGPVSAFINSLRTQAVSALGGVSKTGTRTKLTDGNRSEVYDNGASFTPANGGVYYALDFLALDDNAENNLALIQDAMDAAEEAGGGRVVLSRSPSGNGKFRVHGTLIQRPKVLLTSKGGMFGGDVQLIQTDSDCALYEIGEGQTDVRVEDIELVALVGTSNTTAILMTGAYSADPEENTATQFLTFDTLKINGFDKPFSIEATDIGKAWQCSYVSGRKLMLHNCAYGFYFDALNTDWCIDEVTIYGRKGSYGIWIENSGSILIKRVQFIGPFDSDGVCVLGVPNSEYAETAVHIAGQHGNLVFFCNQLEGFRQTLVNEFNDKTYPIMFIGNTMGAPILLNESCKFHIEGSTLYDNTVQAAGDTEITSINNFAFPYDTCLAPVAPEDRNYGFILTENARMVLDASDFGVLSCRANFGDVKRPDDSDPLDASTPIIGIGSAIIGKLLLALYQKVAGVDTLRYALRRPTDGFLELVGYQGSPNQGLKIPGPLEMPTDATAVAPAATKIRLNWTGTLLQLLTNGSTFNMIVASTVMTVNRYQKALANGRIGNALLSDNDTDVQVTSGGLVFGGHTSSQAGFFRSSTVMKARLGDNSADADFTAGKADFSKRLTSAVVALTDAATIATDASLGNRFRVSSAVDRTLGIPTNPTDGQRCTWEWKNTDGADHTLTLTTGSAGAFRFGATIAAISATVAGKTDKITAEYNATDQRWDVVDYLKGFV